MTYNPSRMYNIAFPVLIIVPLIFVLVVLFTLPIEKTILTVLPMVNMGTKGLSGGPVGLHIPTRPGVLSSK